MAFRVSPGVNITEKSATTIVPSVGTTEGGYAGHFQWGPVEEILTLANEKELSERLFTPDGDTYVSFFTVANFLSYTNQARVVRASSAGMKNAVANGAAVLIKNRDQYDSNFSTNANTYGMWAAKYPGTLGTGLKVETFHGTDQNAFDLWIYNRNFDGVPGTSSYASARGGSADELHVVVVDSLGKFSGTANTVLERFGYLSKASDAKNSDGTSNYYKNVINGRSKYIYHMAHPDAGLGLANASNWGVTSNNTFETGDSEIYSVTLANGAISTPTAGNVQTAYSMFINGAEIDVALIMTGDHANTVVNYAIQSIAEVRKDCVVFASPSLASVVNNYGSESSDVITDGSAFAYSTYAFVDCGWKYQYDQYNDVYRWVPLNGDMAGLAARTDLERDPWYSFAGYNRGHIKNVYKLAWNPTEANRNDLYRASINPVITEKGEGTLLFGDKTHTSKPDAFDRVNVRRLFIVLEKAIARAAKYSLFELNDNFTRAQFVAMVEPFLRNVQGRGGITDFQVVCDTTNNTGDVIDRNEFVGDIKVKPARSINYITLNFTAVGTSVSFNEIG